MGRTTRNITKPGFLVEQGNAARDPGRQVDWDAFGASYENEFGNVELKQGMVVSLDDTSGKIIPRNTGDSDLAEGILASSANEDSDEDSLSGYGLIRGGVVYEDLIDLDGGTLSTIKTELNDNNPYGFNFASYNDDR
jgi:hypothetical protein